MVKVYRNVRPWLYAVEGLAYEGVSVRGGPYLLTERGNYSSVSVSFVGVHQNF